MRAAAISNKYTSVLGDHRLRSISCHYSGNEFRCWKSRTALIKTARETAERIDKLERELRLERERQQAVRETAEDIGGVERELQQARERVQHLDSLEQEVQREPRAGAAESRARVLFQKGRANRGTEPHTHRVGYQILLVEPKAGARTRRSIHQVPEVGARTHRSSNQRNAISHILEERLGVRSVTASASRFATFCVTV